MNTTFKRTGLGLGCLTLFFLVAECRADWTGFRNDGASTINQELPQKWSPTSGIAWQCELPGYGQSTPVVMDNHLLVTAAEGPMKERLLVLCFDLATGQQQWKNETTASQQAASNYMASRAAPTPVVDQRGVYAFFESGDCVAIDHHGQTLWHRSLTTDYGAFDNNHGLGSSPAQNATHLFLNVEHKGPSYLVALDKRTGETAWKVERKSSSSWSSPIFAKVGDQAQVIVSSGGSVTGYDAASGEQLWNVDGLDGNSVPSPTLHGQRLYIGARLPEFAEEGSSRSNCCINFESSVGTSAQPQIAWRAEKAISDYASPVVNGNFAYFLNKSGVLYCLDTVTGKVHYANRLGTQCWGTPIVAGDSVYFFGKDGKTQIVRVGAQFELIASNELWPEDAPPKPEKYTEHTGPAHGHGDSPGAGAEGRPAGQRPRGGPGGGMAAALQKADSNGDGTLSAEEIPADFKPMLARIDLNGDGSLDKAELKAMADSFAARRADSQSSARDPIVYGAAASKGKIVFRTGTRLYCVQ